MASLFLLVFMPTSSLRLNISYSSPLFTPEVFIKSDYISLSFCFARLNKASSVDRWLARTQPGEANTPALGSQEQSLFGVYLQSLMQLIRDLRANKHSLGL